MTYEKHPVPSDAESNEYATPRWIVRDLARTLPTDGALFDLDPASGAEHKPLARERYTPEDDGLAQPWHGYVWLNPPWSSEANDGRMKATWLRKSRNEAMKDDVDAVFVLLPDDTSTEWFREHAAWATTVTFLGRVSYIGQNKNPAFGSMILTYGDLPERAVAVLENMGPTYLERQRVDSAPQQRLGEVTND